LELHKPGLAVPTFSFQSSNATTARLAQLGEHPSAKREVVGSTLAVPTTKVFKKTCVGCDLRFLNSDDFTHWVSFF